MKSLFLRHSVFVFLIFTSSVGSAEKGASSAAEAFEKEKAKLYQSIYQENFDEVKRRYSDLIKQGNSLIWSCWGWANPLSYAISNSSLAIVDFFLGLPNADEWLKEKNEFGRTTIHNIVQYRDLILLKKVMSFSGMEGLLREKDNSGLTPFQLALDLGKTEVVRFLLDYPQARSQLPTRNLQGETIFHSAIHPEKLEIVRVVFDLPEARSLILENNIDGFNILRASFSFPSPEAIIGIILNQPEALQLISSADESGSISLHYAPPEAFFLLAQFLENHPNYLHLLRVKNQIGRTPLLELLLRHAETDLTQLFGLKVFERLLFEADDRGQNLAHFAIRTNRIKTSVQFARLAQNPKKLFGEPDNEGTSALGLVVMLGTTRIVGALLAEGIDFEKVLINHKTFSAIEYLTHNLTGADSIDRERLLQFLLSRPTEESQSSGWSSPK